MYSQQKHTLWVSTYIFGGMRQILMAYIYSPQKYSCGHQQGK